jgi:hypothetical protein
MINGMMFAICDPVSASAPAPTQPYQAPRPNDDADMHMDMSAGMKK